MHLLYIDDLFLNFFPNGLNDASFTELGKKYRSSNKVLSLIKEYTLTDLLLSDSYHLNNNIAFITKIVTLVPMVSTFEKIAFKNYINHSDVQVEFCLKLYALITNNNQANFEAFIDHLCLKKNERNCNAAKWPIITFFLAYFNEDREVFIKPTTTKKLANVLGYDIKYQAYPNYQTYTLVKEMILDYKKQSHLVAHESNIIVQAVIFCALSLGGNSDA
ncbi:MAG: hypothetical protein ACRCTA_01510 [Bacilli bacterium]